MSSIEARSLATINFYNITTLQLIAILMLHAMRNDHIHVET